LKSNIESDTELRFVQVQLPEQLSKKSEAFEDGYFKISDIGKERIRRAAKKILEENNSKLKELKTKLAEEQEKLVADESIVETLQTEISALEEKLTNFDSGFKVFKLDSSNIRPWDGNPENLEDNLFNAGDNIKSDRSAEDVLYEVLLKYGLDLTLPIAEREIEGHKVFSVGYGALFLCLDKEIKGSVAEGIGQWKEELQPELCRVIFRDAGFTDVAKTNATQTLKRFGITEVKSI